MNQLFKSDADGPLDLSQRIIENYRQAAAPMRSDYLDYLTRKTLSYAEYQAQEKQRLLQPDQKKDICQAVVERVFALLEPYTAELNRVNKLKQLHITAVSPAATAEVLEYDRNRRPLRTISFYRARFSTSRYSLVVRGLKNCVEFFILPADRVIGLTAAESQSEPLMVFAADDSGTWWVEGKNLSADRFERFSLLALEHLLDCTQEELVSLTRSSNIAEAFI